MPHWTVPMPELTGYVDLDYHALTPDPDGYLDAWETSPDAMHWQPQDGPDAST